MPRFEDLAGPVGDVQTVEVDGRAVNFQRFGFGDHGVRIGKVFTMSLEGGSR